MHLAPVYRNLSYYVPSPPTPGFSNIPALPNWFTPPDQYNTFRTVSQPFSNTFNTAVQSARGAASTFEPLKVGEIAPNFRINNQDGQPVDLYQELRKGPVVLFFYPKDKSRYCTRQAQEFEQAYPALRRVSSVFGISGDSEQSHREFIAQNGLNYPLLSDPGNLVRKKFGAEDFYGWVPGRVTFVIEPMINRFDGSVVGRIRMAYSSQTEISDHIKIASAALGFPQNPFARL